MIIPEYSATLEILEYKEDMAAEALSHSDALYLTGHGLVNDDFIVNKTRRSATQMLAERGSRRARKANDNLITLIYSGIVGQAEGDIIALFHYEDKTHLLKDGTLSINDRAGGQSECSFDTRDIDFKVGQYVRVKIDGELRFGGIISNFTHTKMQNSIDEHLFNVSCTGFNTIPSRRTININYAAETTSSAIVEALISSYLYQEGIIEGEITDGILIDEEWVGDVISVSDVLDEISSRNGFQWFINNNLELNFYKDATTVSDCTYTIESGGTFTDYRDISVIESIESYVNKAYTIGGNDDHGDVIWTMNGDLDEQNNMQIRCGGTGVYGTVHRDSEIVNHEYKILEAGTSATQVNLTGHGLTVGDYFWNITRGEYSRGYVTSVSSTVSFICTSIANQTVGDEIETYKDANIVGKEIIRKQGNIPQTVEFKSYHTEFYPQTKITISVSDMSLSGVYNISEVNISDRGSHYFETVVKAELRNEADFSTQKSPDYKDFFRGL